MHHCLTHHLEGVLARSMGLERLAFDRKVEELESLVQKSRNEAHEGQRAAGNTQALQAEVARLTQECARYHPRVDSSLCAT